MSDEHLMGAKGAGHGPACLDNPLIDRSNMSINNMNPDNYVH